MYDIVIEHSTKFDAQLEICPDLNVLGICAHGNQHLHIFIIYFNLEVYVYMQMDKFDMYITFVNIRFVMYCSKAMNVSC